jgi:hypothetical protein
MFRMDTQQSLRDIAMPAHTLTAETRIRLAAAARSVPPIRAGRAVHPSTVLRWILRGSRLPDGSRLRLEAVRTPGGWFTSREAIDRFLAALTEAALARGGAPTPAPRTPAQRRRSSARAAEQLAAVGI